MVMKDEERLSELMLQVLSIPNPQYVIQGRAGEAALLDFVCRWLDARAIPYESDIAWGVHAVLTSSAGQSVGSGAPASKPAVLLAAHLDSDNLDVDALASLRLDATEHVIRHKGDVGLDCKTGVCIALSVLEHLRPVPPGCCVHVLFTVGEESGQKGAIRAPLPELLAGVRYGIVIDRMTTGSAAPRGLGQPLRHVVTKYKGVPLLDENSGDDLMRLLEKSINLVESECKGTISLKGIESPNCSDALELCGRWKAEVVGRKLLCSDPGDKQLTEALREYDAITATIRSQMDLVRPEERVSGMNAAPRYTRYEAMQKVHRCIAARKDLDSSLWFSCVNLSYDYAESRGCLSLTEIANTINILISFMELHFSK
eukprot:CAMPEP_0180561984 /NCGR_PEP_ID=MMETSP1037_2-20121125/3670_1 /TAXON_ID=632150 /ORGANISM="Azadinium spinosum, Strain 3D9" /LENGTH=370 /DNA_ID=CAMNT_0022578657 /DNA_START=66 /DNA_END=1175 /DNA_ORIENTATION=+